MRTRSRGWAIGVAVACALVLLTLVFVHLLKPDRRVAMPSDEASPEQVVRAYVAALDADDARTARALSVPAFRQDTDDWLRNVSHLGSVRISSSERRDPSESGLDPDLQVAEVGVSFDVRRAFWHSSTFNLSGSEVWGYSLVRAKATDPWRIFDDGVG